MGKVVWSSLAIGLAASYFGSSAYTAAYQAAPGRTHSLAPIPAHQQPSRTAAHRELLDEYCVTCHDDDKRTAGLSFERIDLNDVGTHAELWERVTAKLRSGTMPPAGKERPDEPSARAFVQFLESEIDRAAASKPDPGRTVAHRLTRAEYANAIRDILDFDFDATPLLPPDNVGYGFDSIGEVLSVSPLLMERYMFAAERIARLAIGTAGIQPGSERYVLSTKLMQRDRMSEDLPFGSQGGVAVRHVFPADGQYSIKLTLQKNADGFIRGLRTPHQIDVRVDGARAALLTVGGESRGRSGPIFTDNQNPEYAGDPAQVEYEFTADEALVAKFKAKAGSHLVGVAVVEQLTKPVGFQMPQLVLHDIEHYKGGAPQLETVTIAGPYDPNGVSDTPSRRRIFTCRPASIRDEQPCATKILGTLARRAYRRPVVESEIQELLGVYAAGRREATFENGIATAVRAILAGPDFLFRIEQDPQASPVGVPYRISDIELATRLSFFLWSSVPDDELLRAAERGTLKDPHVLEQQVRRMLADRRSRALVDNFAGQWLMLRDLAAAEPDREEFPDFDHELRDAFRQETELFVESSLREDQSVIGLLNADYSYVNERLAHHYGIPDVFGSRFRRVSLPDDTRRGLLGQGSFLTVTSYANRTSPVLRGKWILERLLDISPPPPPPDVPALQEKSAEGKKLTMRGALEHHRTNAVCASCHKLMDPFGFALENFDAVGRYRTIEAGTNTPVDPSGVLYDGAKFQTLPQFRAWLLQHPERFVHTFTKNLLTYATSRPLEYQDMPALRRIIRDSASKEHRWSSLILGVVNSAPFRMRRSGPS